MAVTKDHTRESTWTRLRFQQRAGPSGSSKPHFSCELVWYDVWLWFVLVLTHFTHNLSPCPFPLNPLMNVVLALVLLNVVVTLGPRNKLLTP